MRTHRIPLEHFYFLLLRWLHLFRNLLVLRVCFLKKSIFEQKGIKALIFQKIQSFIYFPSFERECLAPEGKVGNNEAKRGKTLEVRSHPLHRCTLKMAANSRNCVCLCVYMDGLSVSQKRKSFVGIAKAISLKCYSPFVQYFYCIVHLCIHWHMKLSQLR